MGGDEGPSTIVDGAIAAASLDGMPSVLVGDEKLLYRLICERKAQKQLDNGLLSLYQADEIIGMDEKPASAMRRKKKSSIHLACQLVQEKKAVGALSAGNSGAMMAVSLFTLGRLEGVLRPAIGAFIPSKSGVTVLLDVGANTECLPTHLFQFALMGYAYSHHILHVLTPRIGVLANGEEESKGTELTRGALALLQQTDLPQVGHCEGRDIFTGSVDVIVCDGFSGNLVLKTAEGTAAFLMHLIKKSYEQAGFLGKVGGVLSRPLFQTLKSKVDHREFGAAPLLGLCAPAYIAHGNSDAYAIRRAIARVAEQGEHDLSTHISALIQRYQYLTK